MDFDSKFSSFDVDAVSGLSTDHLSCIVDLLLPGHMVGGHRVKEFNDAIKHKAAQELLRLDLATATPVGSTCEGLNVPNCIERSKPHALLQLSDVDIMFVVDGKFVSFDQTCRSNDSCVAIVDTREEHVGYCRLEIAHTEKTSKEYQALDTATGKSNLNRSALQDSFLAGVIGQHTSGHIVTSLQGPAVQTDGTNSINLGNFRTMKFVLPIDYVLAFKCSTWPDIAEEWTGREIPNNWYGGDLKNTIVSNGCHLVAACHRQCARPEIQWRLSFVAAEGVLARTAVTDAQRSCYIYVKLLYHQSLKVYGIITSYHLKNIFFFACEKLPLNAWQDNAAGCIMYVIDLLLECVRKKCLPNYFVPQNNMIDYVNHQDLKAVEHALVLLRKDPLSPILIFTDKFTVGINPTLMSFREIAEPVLKDQMLFLQHKNIQQSLVEGFTRGYCNQIITLVHEGHPKKIDFAVLTTADFYNMLIRKGMKQEMSLAQFFCFVSSKISNVNQNVAYMERLLCDHDDDVEYSECKGRLARLYHVSAYSHPEESESRVTFIIQSESLLAFLSSSDHCSSENCIDYAVFLMKQEREDEALVELSKALELATTEEYKHTMKILKDENKIHGRDLQEEIEAHGALRISSHILALYLSIECHVTKKGNGSSSTDIDNLLGEFHHRCEATGDARGYGFLGLVQMKLGRTVEAQVNFKTALTLWPEHILAKQRIDEFQMINKLTSCDIGKS